MPARNCWLLSTFCRKGMLVCRTEVGGGVVTTWHSHGKKRLKVPPRPALLPKIPIKASYSPRPPCRGVPHLFTPLRAESPKPSRG